MKILLSSFFLLLIFVGCNKSRDYNSCLMTQLQTFENGNLVSTQSYEYDGQRRIKKVDYDYQYATYDRSVTYNYFSDSVVVTTTHAAGNYSRMTYLLNSAGLATSAKITSSLSSPNNLQFDYAYSYNADG